MNRHFGLGKKNTTRLDKSHNKSKLKEASNTKISQMSSITDTKFDGKSSEEPEKTLEKLIKKYSKINTAQERNINDYCIENSLKDLGFLNQITTINKQLDDFVFTSPKEKGEKCRLVEKSVSDKCKEENIQFTESVKKLEEEVKKLKSTLFKDTGENNFVIQAADYQNRLKSDNAKQLRHMETMVEECKLMNKMLREELSQKIIMKDSLMNALTTYIGKYDQNMAEELKNLVAMYDNQYYKVINMGSDEKYVDDLFSKIKVIERKIASKNKEIKELERYLVLPGDKYRNNKQVKSLRANRPTTVNKVSIDAAAKKRKEKLAS